MLRFVNICLVLGLVALAYVIYEVKYEARALDTEIAGLKKDIEAERDGVALLRAEWSLLNSPERIERLAEKHLKLAPARPSQLVTLETLKDSDFEWSALMAKEEASRPAAAKAVADKTDPAKTESAKEVASDSAAAANSMWSTTTIAAEPAPGASGPVETIDARPKVKPPVLATSVYPPVFSASGE
jgi:cell division protein FtsL